MRDAAIAVLHEEHHLTIPRVGVERPTVGKCDDRTGPPIFVVDFGSVFRRDRCHVGPPISEANNAGKRIDVLARSCGWLHEIAAMGTGGPANAPALLRRFVSARRPAIPARRDPDELTKAPGTVTLIREAGGERDLRQRKLRGGEQLLHPL